MRETGATMARTDVVVGTDGTPTGADAVQWAAREAQRRGVLLRIVHAFDWDYETIRPDCAATHVDVTRQLADAVTEAALRQARDAAPEAALEADALIGAAAEHLIELSETVALVVVGTRSRSGWAGFTRGSVSRRVAVHAACPVVVIRGDRRDGPVVAGVDTSAHAEAVLRAGYEAAARCSTGLQILRSVVPTASWIGAAPAEADAEQDRLDHLLTPWRDEFPRVPTTTALLNLPAAEALEAASHRARLIVVGGHRRRALTGTLLGATGRHLVHHSDCPVLIIPSRWPQQAVSPMRDLRPSRGDVRGRMLA